MLNHASEISPNWFHANQLQISELATKVEPWAAVPSFQPTRIWSDSYPTGDD
jgi:hypothetical protein